MADKLIVVSQRDLVALLDYSQPDEEKDIEREPENDNPAHIVYVIRRLREQAQEEDGWPIEEASASRTRKENPMFVLIVEYKGDYEEDPGALPVDIHGPFETLVDAQAYAERYRERQGLPGPATGENNEIWTDAGWYFGIVQPRRDPVDSLPGSIGA